MTLAATSLVDSQEARASELEALGDFQGAHRVLMCGAPTAPWGNRACGRRDCPRCAERAAARNAARVLEGLRRFEGKPVAVLLTTTVSLDKLAEGIESFREALATLRRRACFRNVLGVAGAIETKLTANERMVNLHLHAALDVDSADLDEWAIATAWREVTGGKFSVDPENREVLSAQRFSKYVTKTTTWSPEPGSLSLEALEKLRRGVKGKRLVVAWGTAMKRDEPGSMETRVSIAGGIEEMMARQPTDPPNRPRTMVGDNCIPNNISNCPRPNRFEADLKTATLWRRFFVTWGPSSNWRSLRALHRRCREWAQTCGFPAPPPRAVRTALECYGARQQIVRGSIHFLVSVRG